LPVLDSADSNAYKPEEPDIVMLATVLRRILHAVLPAHCHTCGRALDEDPVPFFCHTCWATIMPIAGPCCPRCGRPFRSGVALSHSPRHLCGACRVYLPSFTRAWSFYRLEPPLQDAIHLFKYHRKVSLASALGKLMEAACPSLPEIDVIIPVPLHSKRLREREFNQSLLLADRLGRVLRRPVSWTTLLRVRMTVPQTELRRAGRLTNLRRAFSVSNPAEVAGKRILLVDDVLTTGTTVNECAKALRKAGTSHVYVATLACTVV
jgi:ComF family protein